MFSYSKKNFQELHAEYVEDNLLSQVRAATVGQEVDVWVLGRTRVRFRVGECKRFAGESSINLQTSI